MNKGYSLYRIDEKNTLIFIEDNFFLPIINQWPNTMSEYIRTEYTNEDTYNFLIDQGADPNGRMGMIFAQACKYNNILAVKLFVEKYKADTNSRGGMPILLALRKNNIGIAKYLIEHGADIHVKQDMPIKMINALEKDNKEGDLEWLKTYLHS
jgi:ankyrin repeat protein